MANSHIITLCLSFGFFSSCLAVDLGRHDIFPILSAPSGSAAIVGSVYMTGNNPEIEFGQIPGNMETPCGVVRKKIELLLVGNETEAKTLFISQSNPQRLVQNIAQLSDAALRANISSSEKHFISTAWFGDTCIVYCKIGNAQDPLYLFDAVTKESGQYKINPNVTTISAPHLLISLQSKTSNQTFVTEDYKWVDFAIDANGNALFDAGARATEHPARYGFRVETVAPTSLEPYAGSRADLKDLSSLIDKYRKSATAAEINGCWRLPADTNWPADRPIDFMGLFGSDVSPSSAVNFVSMIKTERGIIYTLTSSNKTLPLLISSANTSTFPVQYGLFSKSDQAINLLLVHDRSLSGALRRSGIEK